MAFPVTLEYFFIARRTSDVDSSICGIHEIAVIGISIENPLLRGGVEEQRTHLCWKAPRIKSKYQSRWNGADKRPLGKKENCSWWLQTLHITVWIQTIVRPEILWILVTALSLLCMIFTLWKENIIKTEMIIGRSAGQFL